MAYKVDSNDIQKQKMKRIILWTINISSIIIGLFFGILWFNRLRLDYNLDGRYFDETASVVYYEESILVYGTLTLFFILIGIISWIIILKKRTITRYNQNTNFL